MLDARPSRSFTVTLLHVALASLAAGCASSEEASGAVDTAPSGDTASVEPGDVTIDRDGEAPDDDTAGPQGDTAGESSDSLDPADVDDPDTSAVTCMIDGATVAAGSVNPADPCSVCAPATDQNAWSTASDGTPCDSGVCVDGACTYGCWLDGELAQPGAFDPIDPCAVCDPAKSVVDGSPGPDGIPCGSGWSCQKGACVFGCQIEGELVAAQEAQEGAPCLVCDPFRDAAGWSVALDGTACGSGAVCGNGACIAGCAIAGEIYAAGALDPVDACGQCTPSESTTDFVDAADGTSCGDGRFCTAGSCTSGCLIGGEVIAPNAKAPSNNCQFCDPKAPFDYSGLPDGTGCDASTGAICAQGSCGLWCLIDGVTYPRGASEPGNPCHVCDSNPYGWSESTNGVDCGVNGVCVLGTCEHKCVVPGFAPYAPGDAEPGNPCLSCNPELDRHSLTPGPAGVLCDGGVCASGGCSPGCFIGGKAWAPNIESPTNPCEQCVPEVSTTVWTARPNGASCGGADTCTAGVCSSTCTINGTPYPAGQKAPGNPCQVCLPTASTTSWTSVSQGTACGETSFCNAGACESGCLVLDTFYASGAEDPANPCRSCAPAVNPTSFVPRTDGLSCGDQKVCVTGSCAQGCLINGTFFNTDAVAEGNPCRVCDPTVSVTGSVARPDGTNCGGGRVCSGGQCEYGCFIGGSVQTTGAFDPDNNCRSCQPTVSTTSFTALEDGEPCDGGTCVTGACYTFPEISSYAPTCGPRTGETLVAVTGKHFAPGAIVAFGGAPALPVTVTSTTTLTVPTPIAGLTVGQVALSVRNATGAATESLTPYEVYESPVLQDSTTVPLSGEPRSLVAANLDADAAMELVVARGEGFDVVQADGSTSLVPSAYHAVLSVAVGDFNGDGVMDVLRTATNGLEVYAGNSGGGYAAPVRTPVWAPGNIADPAVADFNGDDLADAITSLATSGTVTGLLSLGDGTFERVESVVAPGVVTFRSAIIGGGSYRDLVGLDRNAKWIRTYFGSGDGAFSLAGGTPLTDTPIAMEVADVDKDGVSDVVVSTLSSGTRLFYGKADGGLVASAFVSALVSVTARVGDLNADGLPDLVLSTTGGLRVFPGTGDRNRPFPCGVLVPAPQHAYDLVIADVTGDGAPDVTLSYALTKKLVVVRSK